MREVARYTAGSESRKVTHAEPVASLKRTIVASSESLAEVEARWDLKVPADGPVSFKALYNEIGWHVTAGVHWGQGMSDDSTFTLLVVPERAPGEAVP